MTWNWIAPPQPTPTLTSRFASITKMLTDGLYACTMPGALLPRAMYSVLNAWMFKHIVRIRLLIAALQDGTVRTRQSPAAGPTRAKAEPVAAEGDASEAPACLVPRTFGWLGMLLASYAKNIQIPTGYLDQLVQDPEMMALLAASPRLVRTMRPLCRALGVALPKFPKPVPPAPPATAPRATPDDAVRVAADVPEATSAAPDGRCAGEMARFAAGDPRFRK